MCQLADAAAKSSGGFKDLWGWPLSRIQSEFGWPESVLSALDHYRSVQGPRPRPRVPADVLMPCDRNWPAVMDRLERPPMELMWKGRESLWQQLSMQRAVAVVGTRRPSQHGLRMAACLGRALAQAGWPVLSGLAEGVDAAAHRACLQADGRPVGVLGTPLNRVYPQEHQALQRDVSQAGLLISEHRSSAPVRRGSFALRNRLMVALARVVVVVECPEGSGALLTAAMARATGRPVWVAPADAQRQSARGSNALLKSGALPLITPEDLIDHIGAGPCLHQRPEDRDRDLASALPETSGSAQRRLLQLIDEGLTLGEMATSLQATSEHVAGELLTLELEGLVVAQPGLRWRSL